MFENLCFKRFQDLGEVVGTLGYAAFEADLVVDFKADEGPDLFEAVVGGLLLVIFYVLGAFNY